MFTKNIKLVLSSLLLVCLARISYGQDDWNTIGEKDIISSDTIKKGKNTLIFINKDRDFDPQLKQRLTDVFFEVYPKEVKTYNKKSIRKVIFIIDPAYEGVAAAGGGIVRFNPGWFKRNPGDVDVVTHESMHLVQDYPDGAGPGWITEGIADYVRFSMGVDNEGAGWKWPDFNAKQSYTDAYRITARFFYWIGKNYKKNIVRKLDDAMRTKSYTDAFWKENTGKTVDELWAEYALNPLVS